MIRLSGGELTIRITHPAGLCHTMFVCWIWSIRNKKMYTKHILNILWNEGLLWCSPCCPHIHILINTHPIHVRKRALHIRKRAALHIHKRAIHIVLNTHRMHILYNIMHAHIFIHSSYISTRKHLHAYWRIHICPQMYKYVHKYVYAYPSIPHAGQGLSSNEIYCLGCRFRFQGLSVNTHLNATSRP